MWELQSLGYPFHLCCDTMIVVDSRCVLLLLQQRALQVFYGLHSCPRTCPTSGAMLCTYVRWFLRPSRVTSTLLALPVSGGTLRTFLRFRSGCHGLPNDVGRRDGTPRLRRFCPKCDDRVLGDEYHLVFECPAVAHLRLRYAALFVPQGQTMLQFLWQRDMVSVVRFVRDCLAVLLSHDDADGSSNQP